MAAFDVGGSISGVAAVVAVVIFYEICGISTSSMIVLLYFCKIDKVILHRFLQLRPFQCPC